MASGEPRCTVVRHGETAWSLNGRHTSRTELELTDAGRTEAEALRVALQGDPFDLVLCSPRRRAQETAELAGLTPYTISGDLQEWEYGDLEGLTTPEIQARFPGWSIWDGPWPGGETAADVSVRANRLIEGLLAGGAARVALVGHGHFSRVLAARWVGEPVGVGRWLGLDTATWSELSWDRGTRVVHHWNVPASL